MIKQGELKWIREHWFRRTETVSAANRVATVLLIPLLPVLAAFIQSFWIWFVRDTEKYQAMLHWLNYPELPTWLLLTLQTGFAAAVLWPLRKLSSLQRGAAVLLLLLLVFYDFFNNRQIVRW